MNGTSARFILPLFVLWLVTACGAQDTVGSSPAYVSPWPDFQSAQYAGPANWLCHPEKTDGPCHQNLDSTVVHPDGSLTVEPLLRDESPSVDCFYVYPTCSMDIGSNSDLEPDEEEVFVAALQAGRLAERCRVFAPVYRQVTLGGLFGGNPTASWGFAYADVFDSFKHYMANHNGGRGVVLIGHSQGARMLTELIATEFEQSAALRSQLVSAYLIGSLVEVPVGEISGGTFEQTPLCQTDEDTGCVVSYATYRNDHVFDEQSIFGRSQTPGMVAACTNPADLTGAPVALDAQYPTMMSSALATFVSGNTSPFADADEISRIETPFFSVPGLAEGVCTTRDGFQFLAVSVNPDPADPRTDDIGGDMILSGWGLHLVDVSLLMGDISRLIGQQAASFSASSDD